MIPLVRSLLHGFFTLCFPPCCVHCSADIEMEKYLCKDCELELRRINPPFCQRCSHPFKGAITQEFTCENCCNRELYFDCAVTSYQSTGIVRELIHDFKYNRRYELRNPLADWLAQTLSDPRITRTPFSAFIPVPLHHIRKRERGFNQAEALARILSKQTGIPLLRALSRTRYTSTQTRLSRSERMENLHEAFRIRQTSGVKGHHLMLVDDIITTGSTVEECSRVLLRAGAASVRVITVARG